MEMSTRSVLLKKSAGLLPPMLAAVCLLFCVGPVHAASTQTGVVANVAPDWSSSAISTISVDPAGGPRKVVNNLWPSGYFRYRRGRFREILLLVGKVPVK